MMKKIYFVCIVACLIGCESIMKATHGIKDPKMETLRSTQTFLAKNDIDTTHTLTFKNLTTFAIANKKDILTIPDALFFNSRGYYIDYNKTPKDCNANVDQFIVDLDKLDQEATNENTIQQLLKLTETTGLKTPEFEKGYDAYVFITWAVYVGKLNKDKAFPWVRLLEKAKANGINVKYYLLNCDFQETWDMTEEQKEMLGVKS